MTSSWIEFVKKYARDKGVSYKEALTKCKGKYSQKTTGGRIPPPQVILDIERERKKNLLIHIARIVNGNRIAGIETTAEVQQAIEWLDIMVEENLGQENVTVPVIRSLPLTDFDAINANEFNEGRQRLHNLVRRLQQQQQQQR
jgi:hypothetical protein